MFKKVKDGKLPTRGSKHSACVDLYAREDIVIGAGETKLVPLGVCINNELLEAIWAFNIHGSFELFISSHYLQLMLRSSLGKKGLILPNGVGVIDLDYKDEIMMIVHNPIKYGVGVRLVVKAEDEENNALLFHGKEVEIKKGDRVAQITLLEHKSYLFGIDTEEERTGGFGSTGSD